MLTLTTITYKLDESFRLEFTNDWEGKYYHLQIINGDLTPLCYIPPASSGSVLCISGIPNGYSSRIYELLVKNTYWIGKIYLLDAPKLLMNKIEEVKVCNEDFGLSFVIEKHKANNIQNITPNLSKYIPEDNAVLFLIEEDCNKYDHNNNCKFRIICQDGVMPKSWKLLADKSCEITIFLPHGTQSEIQKAKEVAKELRGKYGVEEVNLFALHCFTQQDYILNIYGNCLEDSCLAEDVCNFNKVITTNSTGILPVQDKERLQVIDAKEIFEEYLNETNLI